MGVTVGLVGVDSVKTATKRHTQRHGDRQTAGIADALDEKKQRTTQNCSSSSSRSSSSRGSSSSF